MLPSLGYDIEPCVLADLPLEELRRVFTDPVPEGTGGTRNILRDVEAARSLAMSEAVRRLITPYLGSDAIAVRGILFDKTADGANWKVPYHQDLSLAVSHTLPEGAPGWGPWTIKAGVPHVQPPAEVLERMLTVRLHLDDCGPDNGPLRVLPGTHRRGRLSPVQIASLRADIPEVLCVCHAGGAVLMRPLLLHASSPVASPQPNARRRVLHLEYAAATIRLPAGLQWHESLAPELNQTNIAARASDTRPLPADVAGNR